MAQASSSSTVPRGFEFHYDEQPKTPEGEQTPPPTANPPSPRGFRVRRRARPRIDTSISSKTSEIMVGLQETALPSVETPDQGTLLSAEAQSAPANNRHVTPLQQLAQTYEQTPHERIYRAQTPLQPDLAMETISRPSSPFSGVSDSSEGSLIDSEDDLSYGGSVTSPESDAADPFSYDEPVKSFDASRQNQAPSPTPRRYKRTRVWTKAMDNHLWSTYVDYVNDPKVTPFKTLAGCPPPVGVCHRVASAARKTWKGGAATTGRVRLQQDGQGSPDTIVNDDGTPRQYPAWPGAGSATRKRLRLLCKRRAPITPHYKRMMRSASPYMAEPQINSIRAGSPNATQDSFATRDVAMSLATSTSTTMRPNGPLAQMASEEHQEWFNKPQATMGAPVPFDLSNALLGASTARLGSPFSGAHTWGPSRTRNRERPRAATLHPGPTDSVPRLRSPVQFASMRGLPFPSSLSTARTPKRPATTALEDELSGSDTTRRIRHEDVLENSFQNASRRLRLRGLSLGAHFAQTQRRVAEAAATVAGPVTRPAPRPSVFASLPPAGMYPPGIEDPFGPAPRAEQTPRLGSPFPGISSRPSRNRGRHVPSLSLPQVPVADPESGDLRMTDGIAE